MALQNLMVRVGADMSSLSAGLRRAQTSLDSFQSRVSRTVKLISSALGTIGAGMGIQSAVQDAMKFEASLEQVNRLMGQSANEFLKWSTTTAGAFNYSKKQAVEYGGIFSNLISTFAKDTKQIGSYTQDLLETNAVIASKTSRTIDDVNERIRSGMLGNTEAIEDLGVFVGISMIESTNAFRQFAGDKSWEQLDFQTQQTIRYFAILEQAANKYGTSVSNNASSQTARLVAQLNDLKLTLGQAFLPIWQAVIPALSTMVKWMISVISVIGQFTKALFGKKTEKAANNTASATSGVASSVFGVGDAYKGAGKAAKKAAKEQKGFVAAFDEINQLSINESSGNDSSDGGAGGSGADTGLGGVSDFGNIDTGEGLFDKVSESATRAAEKIKGYVASVRSFFGGLKNFIVENKDIIIAALSGIGAALLVVFGPAILGAIIGKLKSIFQTLYIVALYALDAIKAAIAFLLTPLGLVALAVGALVAAFVYFYRTNDKFKGFVDGILQKIADAAIWLWKNALIPLGNYLAGVFKAAWETVIKIAEWLWKNVLVPFGSFLKDLWKNLLIPIGKVIGEFLVMAFKGLVDISKELWQKVLVPLGQFISTVFVKIIETLAVVFLSLWENVLKPLAVFISKSLGVEFKSLGQTITDLWEKVLKPVAKYIGGIFKQEFVNVFDAIGGIIKGFQKIFEGLLDFIQGVFTGNWRKAWQGVKDIFKGIWDTLVSAAKLPLNTIIDMINRVIGALNSLSIHIPDWVPVYGGKTWGISIPKIPKLARGGIVDGATNFGNYIAGEAGAEMIVPLENTSFVEKIASALGTAVMNAMSSNSQSSSGDIVLKLNEVELGRASAKGINKAQRISGKLLLDI